MTLLTARHSLGPFTTLVLIALVSAAGAGAEPPAVKPPTTADSAFVEVRCRGANDIGDALFRRGSEAFGKSHPQVAIKYGGAVDPSLTVAQALAAGELELAYLMGPVYRRNGTAAAPDNARRDLLMEVLEQSKCDCAVIGRNAMAVVVHPQNPLQEISQGDAERLLQRKITSWSALGQENRPIQLVTDERASFIIRECAGAGFGNVRAREISKGIEQLAGDPWAIGFMCIDKRLAGSGLKILPIRPTGGKEVVPPSAENVASGKYPFYGYLLLACGPKAPAAALQFRKSLEDPQLEPCHYWWLPKLNYTLPGEAREEMWPNPDDRAAAAVVSGAVAVLPLEQLSAEFVMADSSRRAAYEQAVADAIAKDGRLKMVDRTELARVLREHKLRLAQGAPPPARPIIAADVLVLSSVVTVDSRSYLSVEAVHAATTSCLGRMRLPIDAARPEEFMASIAPKTAQWWPGVLRNLAAALDRPVWTFLPPALPNHTSPDLTESDRALLRRIGDVQASLEEKLLADRRVFFARPGLIPNAQQEVLMGLLGISRPASSRFTPLADFLLQGEILGEGKIRLRVLRGGDLQAVRETVLESSAAPAAAGDWISAQLAGLADRPARTAEKRPAATHSSAAAQAALELQQIPELRKQLEAFRRVAYERWRAAGERNGLDVYLAEDKKELDRREEEIARHYRRAAQLDPTCETTAYEAAMAACNGKGDGLFVSQRRKVDVLSRFLDTFPDSKHAATLARQVSDSYYTMAHFLSDDAYRRSGSYVGVPTGLERAELYKECRQGASVYAIRHLGLLCSARPKPSDSERTIKEARCELQRRLDDYAAMGVPEAEFEEVAGEYGRTLDAFFEMAPPADFQRLHYLAVKKKKEAFVDLLLTMQRRWPDPSDVHWKLGKDQALDDLCQLFRTDPRGTSFWQWLRGKRGIGELPWKGYDPKEDAEPSTSGAPQ